MKPWHDEKALKLSTILWSILLGLVTVSLLCSVAYAQSIQQDLRHDLSNQLAKLQNPARMADRPPIAQQPDSRFNTALVGYSSSSRRGQTQLTSPLPPASAFALQTNLCKYLDTCPTPGATSSPNEPPDEELSDEDLM